VGEGSKIGEGTTVGVTIIVGVGSTGCAVGVASRGKGVDGRLEVWHAEKATTNSAEKHSLLLITDSPVYKV
jgi:hypothetical protein